MHEHSFQVYHSVHGTCHALIWHFYNAIFFRKHNYSSQLNLVIYLADRQEVPNVLHYRIINFQRIVLRSLPADLFTLTYSSNQAGFIRLPRNYIFNLQLCSDYYTYSRNFYECQIGISEASQKSIFNDFSILFQAYTCRRIRQILWIPSRTCRRAIWRPINWSFHQSFGQKPYFCLFSTLGLPFIFPFSPFAIPIFFAQSQRVPGV